MENITDLDSVKRIAKGLLNISILETEYSPMIVSHPFTKSGIVTLFNGKDFVMADITKDKDSFNKWKQQMINQIDEAQNVHHIYYLLNDSYRLLFFNNVSKFLSQEDFSVLLGEAWVSSDYANNDANVTKKELLSHFKKANKKDLMSESELETFDELDDEIIIYRGLTLKTKNDVKALSWTTSFGKAKWFAERWGDGGVVYSATIDKKNVFAYFDRKDEDEVVIDYNYLRDLQIVNKPKTKKQNLPTME